MSIISIISGSGKTAPSAPTIGTATDVGSGRTFVSGGRADVTFTAPAYTGRSPITSYTVTSNTGGFTGTGASSPISVTGLTPGNAYTFTVTATNAIGTSSASSASNSITATTIPETPTITSATRTSNTAVSIAFTGATGGSAITAVTATSSPSVSITSSGTSSPMTATATYSQGTGYTFTITATNANGTSSSSSASGSVTPYALPTLGAFSVATDYPTATGRYVTGSSSSTSNGIMFAGTDGQTSRSDGYYWNNSSWVALGTYPSQGQVSAGRTMNTGSQQIQVVSPGEAQSKTYYISGAGGSWSTGTDVPSNAPYTPIAFVSTGSVRATLGASPFTSYYRTGTGAWTATTSAPIATDQSQSAADSGTIYSFTGSTSYTAGLTGAWTAAAAWNGYWTSGNTQNNMWTYYDGNGSGMYVWTTSGATYAGTTIPLPSGFTTWDTMRMFGSSDGKLHIATGRRGNAPNPSYPGVVTHYQATIT